MSTPRQPLYQRLPEIYHIRDAEQLPPYQLKAFVDILDNVLAGVRDNIEALYHDLFIDTCDDWVVAYIADLLGTSHLSGDPWTLRADVARSVYHRRRKGTLGAIESLTYSLSGWAVHAVELRERLLWNQHLNHQRPDAGGRPPLQIRDNIVDAVRGGTVTVRDPASLSFLGRAFDPFARVVDVKPVSVGQLRPNLPNLGIFLWRLEDYHLDRSQPVCQRYDLPSGHRHAVDFTVRAFTHPMAEPMQLFNVHDYNADQEPPNLADEDAVPGPIPTARLSQDTPAGRPKRYVKILPYDPAMGSPSHAAEFGLVLHVPLLLPAKDWTLRGANLCAWEDGLFPALRKHEVVIDPVHGRLLFGVVTAAEADAVKDHLLVSPTYGFSGPTGAHPVARSSVTSSVVINAHDPASDTLQNVLDNIDSQSFPFVIEIQDSLTHDLNLSQALRLKGPLHIRAASQQRPVIRLATPLQFRAAFSPGPGPQPVAVEDLEVILEGLCLTRQAGFTEALIQQAAVNQLRLEGCTLDPGGALDLDGSDHGGRMPIRVGLQLDSDFGFAASESDEKDAFLEADQIPEVVIYRSISGPLAMDDNYTLVVTESILDAGAGIDDSNPALAVYAASGDPETGWGPPLTVTVRTVAEPAYQSVGLTCFGRMRVQSATGEGGIWLHRLEAHDNQQGCIKFSYFSGDGDRLPPNHGCVYGYDAQISFASEIFGQPGYAQLRLRSDSRILEQGPNRDAMGAFGYLQNTHKWKNINIRYREFMPVGIRPVLIPVT